MAILPTKQSRLSDIFNIWITQNGIFSALSAYGVPWKNDVDSVVLDTEYFGNISGEKRPSPLVKKLLDTDNATVLSSERIEQLASVIYKLNAQRWAKLYDTLQFEYNPISNYDMTETETHEGAHSDTTTHGGTQTTRNTGTQTDTRTGTVGTIDSSTAEGSGSGNTERGIYGFNSATSSGDSEDTTTTTSRTTASGNSTRTDNLTDARTDDFTQTRTDSLNDATSGTESGNRTLTRSGNIGVTTSQQMIESERELWLWNYFYSVIFPDVDGVLTIATY